MPIKQIVNMKKDKLSRSLPQQLSGAFAGVFFGGIVSVASVYFLAAVLPNSKDLIIVAFLIALAIGVCVSILIMRNIARRQIAKNGKNAEP